MRILVSGPQGSGKTTQAEILANKLKVPVVEAGSLLRELAESPTELGQSVKKELAEGHLVQDEIIANLIKEKVGNLGGGGSFVGDGYPRSVESLQNYDPRYDLVFYLEIADGEVEKRLLQRGRADDTPQLIRERLAEYHLRTEPVLSYYAKLGKLVRVDGTGSIEEVAQKITDHLSKLSS